MIVDETVRSGLDPIRRSFRVLGIRFGASPEEVKEAYRDLVKVWHPDRFRQDPRLQAKAQEKLKKINQAYEVLSAHLGPVRAAHTPGPEPPRKAPTSEPSGASTSPPRPPPPQAPPDARPDPAPPPPRGRMTLTVVFLSIGATLFLLLLLFKGWPQPDATEPADNLALTQSEEQVPDLSSILKVTLQTKARSIGPDDAVPLVANITNVSAERLAIAPAELFRDIDFKFEPDSGGIGDPVWRRGFERFVSDASPGGPQSKLTVLEPTRTLTRTYSAGRNPADPKFQPGTLVISVKYCHFNPGTEEGTDAPTGCVSSNEVRITVRTR